MNTKKSNPKGTCYFCKGSTGSGKASVWKGFGFRVGTVRSPQRSLLHDLNCACYHGLETAKGSVSEHILLSQPQTLNSAL